MRKNLSRLLLKALGGFLIGLAVWGGLSAPYTRLLGFLTETAVRVAERPAATRLTPSGTLLIVDRSDIPPSPSGRFAVESTDITFNLIILITLFAASDRAFSDRNIFGFAAAALGLVFVHVAAVLSFVEAYYALSLGAWSTANYGSFARLFWGRAPYFYSIIGVYGSAVALWWLFRPDPQAATKAPRLARGATRVSKRVRV